jgi:AcrR family transcriptional regulator
VSAPRTRTPRHAAADLPSTADRLLRAAEELIGERGMGNVSVRDITARAKANTAAINYYFGTKEGLIQAIVERRAEQIGSRRTELLDEVMATDPSVRGVVRVLVRASAELAADRIEGGRTFLRCRQAMRADPEAAMLLEKHFGPYTRRFLDALEAVTPQLPPMDRAVRFAMARDLVDASFANDMLPVWLARRAGAQPTPDEIERFVTEFLVAAFEAPAVTTS